MANGTGSSPSSIGGKVPAQFVGHFELIFMATLVSI